MGGGGFLWIFFVHDIMSIFVLKKHSSIPSVSNSLA